MLKGTYIALWILLFIITTPSQTSPYSTKTYKSALGFQVELPQWDTSELIRDDYYEFICAHSKYIYIKIYKLKIVDHNILGTLTWKIWEIDPNAHFIIKSKTNNSGIIVTTYKDSITSIHRLRIDITNDTIFIIECSAPEKTFYTYEEYFNRVFKSFSLL